VGNTPYNDGDLSLGIKHHPNWKQERGTRVMTVHNGNSLDDRDNPRAILLNLIILERRTLNDWRQQLLDCKRVWVWGDW